MNSRVASEVGGNAFGAAPLADVIQLRAQGLGELLGEPDEVVAVRNLPAASRRGGHVSENFQVLLDLFNDTGPAHLNDNFSAVRHGGPVSLADRRRRERRPVEGGEQSRQWLPELRRNHRLDLVGGHRWGLVLQLRQLRLVVRGEEIGPCRDDLPELDEGRAQLREGHANVFGLGVRPGAARMAEDSAMEGHEALQAEHPDEVAQSVARQRIGDLAVASPV